MSPPAPKAKTPARQPFPFPWGLFVVLGLYAGAVYLYIYATYWESPAYQAAVHYAKAIRLLGVDDGRKCTEAELAKALEHILEAARLVPEEKGFASHSEGLRWRFDERGFKIPEDLKRRTELVSKHAQRIDQERQAWLVIGSRDKGWAPDQLLAGPEKTVWYSIPGGVLIIAFWAYTRFTGRRGRDELKEDQMRDDEDAMNHLADYRRGLGNPESKVAKIIAEMDLDEMEEEGDSTLSNAPPPKPIRSMLRPPEAPKPKERPPSQSRPAVARRNSEPGADGPTDRVDPRKTDRPAGGKSPSVSISSPTGRPPKRKG